MEDFSDATDSGWRNDRGKEGKRSRLSDQCRAGRASSIHNMRLTVADGFTSVIRASLRCMSYMFIEAENLKERLVIDIRDDPRLGEILIWKLSQRSAQ